MSEFDYPKFFRSAIMELPPEFFGDIPLNQRNSLMKKIETMKVHLRNSQSLSLKTERVGFYLRNLVSLRIWNTLLPTVLMMQT